MARTVVYTAIFGGYDELPTVQDPAPDVAYIAFTDDNKLEPRSPWEIRVLPRVFDDPQLDARRVKLLPHLFLPQFEYSLWIDANVQLGSVPESFVLSSLSNEVIALPAHEERSCIYSEADVVIERKKDNAGVVRRQMQRYRTLRMPEGFGLHATMFMARRHMTEQCILFSSVWWGELSKYSKRDQLSFDFIRWMTKVDIVTLPIKYSNNQIFYWGGKHAGSCIRIDERLGRSVRKEGVPYEFLAAEYDPVYDYLSEEIVKKSLKINQLVKQCGENMEGNLFYFNNEPDYLFSPPDPRRGKRREIFLRSIAGKNHVFELGFNAGHSALFALAHEGAIKYTSLDICIHKYTESCANLVKSWFGERFSFIKADSKLLARLAGGIPIAEIDCVHIDGGHELDHILNDWMSVLSMFRPGTEVIVDDYYVYNIFSVTQYFVDKGFIKPVADLEHLENACFTIIGNIGESDMGLIRHELKRFQGFALLRESYERLFCRHGHSPPKCERDAQQKASIRQEGPSSGGESASRSRMDT